MQEGHIREKDRLGRALRSHEELAKINVHGYAVIGSFERNEITSGNVS
jgi:hypothetical protein